MHELPIQSKGFSMIGRTAYQSEVYSMFGRTAQPECRIFIIRRAAHPNQSEGFSIIG